MKRFLTIAAILLVVGFVVAKNRQMCSYVCTTSKMLTKQFKGSVSPEFEIERLKGEIANLTGDVDRLIQEEATLKYDLTVDQAKTKEKEADLAKTEASLKAFAEAVKTNADKSFSFTNTSFTPVTANSKLKADYKLYQEQKKAVEYLKKGAASKEKQYNSVKIQREKIFTTQQTYKAQLEQLASDWATLKNETNSTSPDFDANRFTQIEDALNNLKRKVEIEKTVIELKNGQPTPQHNSQTEVGNQLDPDTVLNAINNPPADKSSVKTTTPQND